MSEAAPALVEVEGLTKTYALRAGLGRRAGTITAVRDLSFAVAPRASLAIVGESGSGKTTTARILLGLEAPSSGRIRLAGEELSASASSAERRRRARVAQLVFQNPFVSLDPRQTARRAIEEVLAFHLRLDRQERRERALALLESVGLGAREAESRPRALSGGQCQRVAIARALAVEPRLLVLDEAVSPLDVSVQAQILNLLAELRERLGVALLVISHDLAVVRQIADEALVMYRGRAVEQGPVDDLLSSPAHPYTQRLLDSVPRPGQLPERTPPPADVGPGGCAFRARCPHAFARCAEEPELVPAGPRHAARCWLVEGRPA